ncbi:4Fe-4S dicluster domain-containing protein [Fodinisporobacter ferrooxydans]|uniref:4Fe-4S dicluster domain-containing protein n=1 Tax=Fodinisporobacter ferrooxydans TaxID=2901836 RepID=A0ABY4CGA9_9BACL|nr:4Fe-4S dicluster domain-containing protein [Alicyclobacillaceae bacterium MYW30-H2]
MTADQPNGQRVMLIDLDSCSGCHACQVACKAEHRAPLGQFRTRVQVVEHGQFPAVNRRFVPTLCQHCEDAPCIPACPVEAIERMEDGIVRIQEEICIGSGDCVSACPYGAIYFDDQDGQAHKCDFCQDRLADGDDPACVATCPTDALHFGFDTSPEIQAKLAAGEYAGQWELNGTRPHIWYKGLDEKTAAKLQRTNAGR